MGSFAKQITVTDQLVEDDVVIVLPAQFAMH